ncbi:MAG: hypothetical protein NTX71_10530 [Candidatus Aureabacteria bacterium]|nr:hypothetical protein [Candidatus Auribacterota bacterium]
MIAMVRMSIHLCRLSHTRLRALLFGIVVGLILAELISHAYLRRTLACQAQYRVRSQVWDPEHLRFALIGSSVAQGYPYESYANLLSYAVAKLSADRPLVIDNYTEPGAPLTESLANFCSRARFLPHLLVICAGNNEYSGFLGQREYPTPVVSPRSPLEQLMSASSFGTLLLHCDYISHRLRFPGDHRLLFAPAPLPQYERTFTADRFRRQVKFLLDYCRRQGIPAVVVVLPPGNLWFPPSRSWYKGPPRDRDQAGHQFWDAMRHLYVDGNTKAAQAELTDLSRKCSFAHLSYELGRLAALDGEIGAARAWLEQAREQDAYPVSCTEELRTVLRDVAGAEGVPVVEISRVMAGLTDNVLPGYELFWDAHHFRTPVYEALGSELAITIHQALASRYTLALWLKRTLDLPTVAHLEATTTEANWFVDFSVRSPYRIHHFTMAREYSEQLRQADAMFYAAEAARHNVDLVSLDLLLAQEKKLITRFAQN